MSNERKQARLALLFSSLIWGIAPPVIKYTLNFLSPFSFLFYRFLFASFFVIIPFYLKIKKNPPSKKDWFFYLFLGFLCSPLNLGFLFLGINRTTAIDASLISIISPILIIVAGAIFLKENVTKVEKIGIFFTFIGTVLTIIQPLWESHNHPGKNIEGNFLVLIGTLVWVIFVILSKKLKHLDPFVLTASSFFVGLVCFSPQITFSPTPLPAPALPGVLFMAIFSSIFAYFAYLFGLSKIEASEATVFTYLQPVFAIPVSLLFLNEKITLPFFLGATLIILGVFMCEHQPEIFKLKQP